MASTRNINSAGDYQRAQHELEARRARDSYAGSAVCKDTYLPGNGLLAGRVGHSELSRNGADIEGFLFGIGSTNLVEPMAPCAPQLRDLKSLSIVESRKTMLPTPLVVQPFQRPRPLN
jgi:hypothetical protein